MGETIAGVAQAVPVRIVPRWPRVGWPALALVATVAGGALAASAAYPGSTVDAAGDLAVAVAFVTCGVVLWVHHRAGDLSGPLMVATGVCWLLGDLSGELALLHRGPLVQLLVAAPTGRPRARLEWVVVVAGYLDGAVTGVGRDAGATAALGLVLAGLAIGRWARAGGWQRRALVVPAAVAVAVALVLGLGAAVGATHGHAVLWCYQAVLVCSAAALGVDRRWGGWASAAMTTVVIDLGAARRGGSLAAALARALGDPSLDVGYRVGEGHYVDERPACRSRCPGPARTVPSPYPGRRHGDRGARARPVNAAAPGLADSVAAAVRLALDNARLHAEIRARLADVAASRARSVRARLRAASLGGPAGRSRRPPARHHRRAPGGLGRLSTRRTSRRSPASWTAPAGKCAGSPPGCTRATSMPAVCRSRCPRWRPAHRCGGRHGRVRAVLAPRVERGVVRLLGGARKRRQARRREPGGDPRGAV